jgi:integrase/recombinase XerC
LDEADVNFVTRELKVTGKRNKQRVIPFGKELEDTLTTYIEVRNTLPNLYTDALLVSPKGERLKDEWVRAMVKKQLSTVSTLKKRTPHVLRHTFATAMLNHEAGLESVQKLLGHESLATTEIYTHTTFEQLKKVYKTAHPRG